MTTQPHTEKSKSSKTTIVFMVIAVVAVTILALWFGGRQGILSTNTLRTEGALASHAEWAQPVEIAGVPNMHKVSDTLYRGAQPAEDGVKNLHDFGIKTIINLRSFHSDRDEIADANLDYEHIWMKAWHPETEEVVRFLKIATDPNQTPVFVHCQHGADRTGTMCAMYRIAVQGWSKDAAIKEMTEGGFEFHGVWDNLTEYILNIDVNDIKVQAGLAAD